MRLIDANLLLSVMDNRYQEKEGVVPDNLAEGFFKWKKLIKEQPTAFDIDNVVEKLEELAEYVKKDWQKYDEEQSFGAYCAYCKAIDIVKGQ